MIKPSSNYTFHGSIFCLLRMSTFLNTKDENELIFIFKFSSYSLHCIQFHKAHFSLENIMGCNIRGVQGGSWGGSYSHFPAQILRKSHRPNAQIPLSLCLPCSNLIPIPIFYCFLVDESQSQCMKSHFPSQKLASPSSYFTPSGASTRGFLSQIHRHLFA